MERKIAKVLMGLFFLYLGTLYLIYLVPSLIGYIMHRSAEYEKPEPYVIFNSILLLFCLIIAFGVNSIVFFLTAQLF